MKSIRTSPVIISMLLMAALFAQAKRRHRPMGDYVREAGLIVVADTRKDRERFQTVVLINEVIKGDPKMAGTEIRLGRGGGRC